MKDKSQLFGVLGNCSLDVIFVALFEVYACSEDYVAIKFFRCLRLLSLVQGSKLSILTRIILLIES